MNVSVLPKRFWSRVSIQPNGCWDWIGGRVTSGYGVMKFDGKSTLTHRLMYEHCHGPIPKGLVVMHVCDRPPCCSPAHLKLGTVSDNTQDMVRKGRGNNARGERNGSARYTAENVAEVRRLAAEGIPYNQIAKRTGMSRWNVSNICRGRSWSHIPQEKAA